MAVLIIGGGLVGSQVARRLVDAGERPVIMDRAPQRQALADIVELDRVALVEGDILRPLALARAIRENEITDVVHTAANPRLTLGAQRDPYGAIELNIMGTVNVLEAARIYGLRRVVVASSNVLSHFLAGGEGAGDPAREDAFKRPTTFYATTKQAVENLGLNYATWCGVDFAALRYGAVAGPWRGRGGGGPSNTIRGAVLKALVGEEIVLPARALEWVYSKDAAQATVLALHAERLTSRVFNITMGYVCSPEALAAAFREAVPGARVSLAAPNIDDVAMPDMLQPCDLSLARQVLGYTSRYDMPEALRDLVQWHARGRIALFDGES